MSLYTVKICLTKINDETGQSELGASFYAGQLSFDQAAATIKEVAPQLDAIRNDWLAKDIE